MKHVRARCRNIYELPDFFEEQRKILDFSHDFLEDSYNISLDKFHVESCTIGEASYNARCLRVLIGVGKVPPYLLFKEIESVYEFFETEKRLKGFKGSNQLLKTFEPLHKNHYIYFVGMSNTMSYIQYGDQALDRNLLRKAVSL